MIIPNKTKKSNKKLCHPRIFFPSSRRRRIHPLAEKIAGMTKIFGYNYIMKQIKSFPLPKSVIEQASHWGVWFLLFLIYWPTLKLLYHSRWNYIDYTHAYFILPVSLFFAWTKRAELRLAANQITTNLSSDLGYGFLALMGLSVALFAWRQDYVFLVTLALLPILFGLVGFLYGSQASNILAFPILYLLFMVPPPLGIIDTLTVPMRYGVSMATEHFLRFFGYPITREGLLLFLRGHEVYLGEACSGFRSLITLSSLGSAYIYWTSGPMAKKWTMAGALAPLAIIGNFLRVVSVVLVTNYIGINQAQKFYHDFSGFVIFLFLVAGLLLVEKMFENRRQKK